ncbi:hypothetical protein [Lactiplantibacillus plantarum]|uniref:DUF7657 domain-containing protein n=1 Tax=Lactiplantibacillus plantarum TaxID=1590 RepID=UPI00034E4B5B|nr:hypothetical protein [Lactiplantibacillus plantarum]EPD25176.1 hypothetical protein L103_03970 [Lactiplantibacillus plantarum IPLA88]
MMTIASRGKKLLDDFIKFRYLIGLVVFLFVIAMNWNGSSISQWDSRVSDRTDGATSSVVLGKSRPVRSDEWMVQTSFYLSQSKNGLKEFNKKLTQDGQNMVISYNSPVKSLSIIGKPFNWGFLFLPSDRALSWYYAFKGVGLFLLSFEFIMILTRRKRYLSLLGAFWITLSPGVQWWFFQHLGDLVYFSLAILVSVFYFFASKKVWTQVGMAALFSSSAIGFILVLYPAFQVMFAYFIIAVMIGFFFKYRGGKVNRVQILLAALSMLFTVVVTLSFVKGAMPEIKLLMNTAYPGKRISIGGSGMPFSDTLAAMSYYLTNWKLSYADATFYNNCELSSFINFFPVVLLTAPKVFKKIRRENVVGFSIFVYCLIMLVWLFVPMPAIIAKITLLSYTPFMRALAIYSFAGMILSIWFVGYLMDHKGMLSNKIMYLLVAFLAAFYAWSIISSPMDAYLTHFQFLFTLLAFVGLAGLFLFRKYKLFMIFMFCFVVGTGATVNPINKGTSAIYQKKLSRKIMSINRKEPDARWVGEGDLYNFLPALGVHTFNGVAFVPIMKTWHKLDPKHTDNDIYNRYEHIHTVIVPTKKTSYQLLQADSIIVNLSIYDLQKFNIKYIAGPGKIGDYHTKHMKLKRMYGQDSNGNYIYKVIYN